MKLLAELLDCAASGEKPWQTIVRIYNDDTSPMNQAACDYVDSIKPQYCAGNPKIDVFGVTGVYRFSTGWHRTVRDFMVWHLIHDGVAVKAQRAK